MLPQVWSGILCSPDLSTALTTQRGRSKLRPTKLARKGQGWDWLCTIQGKTSPFSHCHATEGLLPLEVAVMGWKPSSLPVPGARWSLLALAEMGQGGRGWDGANTGAHRDVSAVPAPLHPELLFTESAVPKPWDIFSVGYKMLLVSRRLCPPSLFWEPPRVLAGQTPSSAWWLSSVPT